MNTPTFNSTATALHPAQLGPARQVVATYDAGLTTRSQMAAVASATAMLFVLGQLLLRWIVL